MIVVSCGKDLAEEWDEYVSGSSYGSFYHRFGWKRINEEVFGHETFYLAAMEGKAICGVLPLVHIKSRIFGRMMCSMPFVNYGGICADNEDAEDALLQEATRISRDRKVQYVEIRGKNRLGADLPTSEKKVSMTMSLENDPEKIWESFRTKHRTNIRRAYKNGLSVRWGGGDLLDEFYRILCNSWRHHGTPIYRKRYFAEILREFPGETAIFVVMCGDRPAATAFNAYCQGTVEGMWAGIHQDFRKLQPMYVLYWEMIKHACEKGCSQYHFGRSSVESGGENFKKKWNLQEQQLYWQYSLFLSRKLPELNVDNPKYQLAMMGWRRLPMRLTLLLGPYLSRSIP